MSVDGKEPGSQDIDDKYSQQDTSSKVDASKDEDKRDDLTKRREDFLNIYKEDKEKKGDGEDDQPDLSNGIKFKQDDESEEAFKMRTSKEA